MVHCDLHNQQSDIKLKFSGNFNPTWSTLVIILWWLDQTSSQFRSFPSLRCCWSHWWIQGGRHRYPRPLRVLILSFWHAKFFKNISASGTGPYGKSWIRYWIPISHFGLVRHVIYLDSGPLTRMVICHYKNSC